MTELYGLCYNLGKVRSFETFPSGLLGVFGREMLDDIEAAFESKVYDHSCRFEDYASKWARAGSDQYYFFNLKSSYRMNLAAIMENIIANGGNFVFDYEVSRKAYLETVVEEEE